MISLGKLCLSAFCLSAIVGCTSVTPTSTPSEPAPKPPQVNTGENSCGAQQVQDRVGRRYDEALGESMHQESGAATLRTILPGHAYTLEYRSDRINIHLDDDNVITQIGCG